MILGCVPRDAQHVVTRRWCIGTPSYEIRFQDFNKGPYDISQTIGHRRGAYVANNMTFDINGNRLCAEHYRYYYNYPHPLAGI